ncbi:VanW family protein [Metallumcola ferriviriculae]|uniref:VanW family protein n=1 Tax=Metallumcola ferriviriculae TaxID=3039180 RepID=A0AAU0URM6_9FIRM|nr:VanW family protein [Desulfitibacteraceae bacterium MK1]
MGALFRHRLSLVGGFLAFGLFISALLFGFTEQKSPLPTILPGLSIGGQDVGGLMAEEAQKVLMKKEDQLLAQDISLNYGDGSKVFTYRQLGISVPLDQLITDALDYGQNGSLWHKIKQRWQLRHKGHDIPIKIKWDEKKIKEKVSGLAGLINSQPVNAILEFRGDQVVLRPSRVGRELVVEETMANLLDVLPLQGKGFVPVSTTPIWPEISSNDVRQKGITGLVAEYVTDFNPSNKPRVENIRVAAANLDGREIAPGEVFSFNDTVGPRTAERGFKNALIIVNHDFVPGIGGGVCQVSSTLYNAVLRANLPVLERYRHSLLIGYVPLGQDATVAYGAKDFKFTNNTGNYLVIKTAVDNNSFNVRLFGTPDPAEVELRSIVERKIPYKTIIKEDARIPKGKNFIEQQGIVGFQVRVEKVLMMKGEELSREVVSRDTYPSQSKILRVGAGDVE